MGRSLSQAQRASQSLLGSIGGASLHPTSPPRRPAKKGVKKEKGVKAEPEVKAEKGIKAEKGVRAEPSSKSPRPISSNVSTPKRFTVTRQLVKEIGEGLLEEEDLEDLVAFEEILKD